MSSGRMKETHWELRINNYFGLNKQNIIFLTGPCEPDPCVNGKCIETTWTGRYVCICKPGFIGKNCDIRKYGVANEKLY